MAACAAAALGLLGGCGGGSGSDSSSVSPGAQIAADADAKGQTRTAEVVLEAYASDQAGSYEGASVATLEKLEPALKRAKLRLSADADTYSVTATAKVGGDQFTVKRSSGGSVRRSCTKPGSGGCSANGSW
jgi:hypothetical protein